MSCYASWIESTLRTKYGPQHWDSLSEISHNIKNYYNVKRIREHLKEVLLGHFYNHNVAVDNLLMKTWQTDYYADAAVSSIQHKMGKNIGIFAYICYVCVMYTLQCGSHSVSA